MCSAYESLAKVMRELSASLNADFLEWVAKVIAKSHVLSSCGSKSGAGLFGAYLTIASIPVFRKNIVSPIDCEPIQVSDLEVSGKIQLVETIQQLNKVWQKNIK